MTSSYYAYIHYIACATPPDSVIFPSALFDQVRNLIALYISFGERESKLYWAYYGAWVQWRLYVLMREFSPSCLKLMNEEYAKQRQWLSHRFNGVTLCRDRVYGIPAKLLFTIFIVSLVGCYCVLNLIIITGYYLTERSLYDANHIGITRQWLLTLVIAIRVHFKSRTTHFQSTLVYNFLPAKVRCSKRVCYQKLTDLVASQLGQKPTQTQFLFGFRSDATVSGWYLIDV